MKTEMVDTPWGTLEAFAGDFITKQIARFGMHQRSDLSFLLSLLRKGDQVVDVGAHIGTYTIPIGKMVGANGSVVAIEPVSDHFILLCRNVSRNGLEKTVRCVNGIVADRQLSGSMSSFDGNSGSARYIPGVGASMRTLRLDDVAPVNTALVKVDVEGMELEVLMSGIDMIERDQPIIVFEVGLGDQTAKLGELFRSMGYRLLVNLHDRNGPDDSFRVGGLSWLSQRVVGDPLPLFDIVAISPNSPRLPRDIASPRRTHAILFGRRSRAIIGRKLGRNSDSTGW